MTVGTHDDYVIAFIFDLLQNLIHGIADFYNVFHFVYDQWGLTLFLCLFRIKDQLQSNEAFSDHQGKMSETNELIIGIGVLIAVFILSRKFHAWRFKRAYISIIDELKRKAAYSAHSAAELPWATRNVFGMGARQHRPQALDHLIRENIVAKTEDGRYYLIQKNISV